MDRKDITNEKSYWNEFYSNADFDLPSQFCTLLATEIPRNSVIVEFGCGNGRDALFLAGYGFQVTAVDLSAQGIEKCREKSRDLNHIEFRQGDVTVESDVCALIQEVKSTHSAKPVVVYSRFFLHSIDDEQEQLFLAFLSKAMTTGDSLYLEFRSSEDENTNKIYGSHYRRYVDSSAFVKSLNNTYNFDINYNVTGTGMAKYKSEDPFVTRIIATKV